MGASGRRGLRPGVGESSDDEVFGSIDGRDRSDGRTGTWRKKLGTGGRRIPSAPPPVPTKPRRGSPGRRAGTESLRDTAPEEGIDVRDVRCGAASGEFVTTFSSSGTFGREPDFISSRSSGGAIVVLWSPDVSLSRAKQDTGSSIDRREVHSIEGRDLGRLPIDRRDVVVCEDSVGRGTAGFRRATVGISENDFDPPP